MSYFIAFVIVYILRVLLRLNWWITGALFVFAVVMVPKHRKRYEKAAENQRRFYKIITCLSVGQESPSVIMVSYCCCSPTKT